MEWVAVNFKPGPDCCVNQLGRDGLSGVWVSESHIE